jgi:phosphoribosyl 1,2-cyclic phosphodiesterase
MRFTSLGSGSDGNALIVEAGETRLMLDCGFTLRETMRRMARIGLAPEALSAIVVTHEHGDHVSGAFSLAGRFGIPVWLTHGTWRAAGKGYAGEVHFVEGHDPFAVGAIEVLPFPVPHDAREPAQFVFSDGAGRLGVLTDTGASTPHIEAMLSGCDALVLECNHDAGMLAGGDYPPSLKARIAGPFGHLENSVSAALLAALDNSRLKHIFAAHLSARNNTPALAVDALAAALGCEHDWIGVATQEEGFSWREI